MIQSLLAAAALIAPTAAPAPPRPVIVEPFPQAPVDPARLAAAQQLMRAIDIQGQMHAVVPRLAIAAATQMIQAFGNQAPPELRQRLGSAVELSNFTQSPDFPQSLIDRIATIYAQHFDLVELQRLTVLMADPAMVKFRAETPVISAETMPVILEALRPQQEQLQAEMKQIVADWLRDHPEDKAKLVHPPGGQGQPQ